VLRRLRFAVRPGWVALHLITVALIVTMVLLGRWQLDVSNSKHFDLQNFGYALQWWAFSVFVLVMWVRVVRDGMHRHSNGSQRAEPEQPQQPPVAYRRYVMPQSSDAPAVAVDSEQAAYNDYLARLAADSAARRQGEGTTG
jgi:DNA-binding transcriptional regulator of glucitol operon